MNKQNKKFLRITEIFFSLQGESKTVGIPTVFVRFTGCPLRCHYCDTSYAFSGGQLIEHTDILKKIATYKTKYVTVTGGEPLAQKGCIPLLIEICDAGYIVSLETSGALNVSLVDQRVIKILDLKTPCSGEQNKNLLSNINYINSQDQIKFVICNKLDYEWAKNFLLTHQLLDKCEVLFSPSYQQQSATELAEWILKDQLAVRFQIQLHKYLWNDEPGR